MLMLLLMVRLLTARIAPNAIGVVAAATGATDDVMPQCHMVGNSKVVVIIYKAIGTLQEQFSSERTICIKI